MSFKHLVIGIFFVFYFCNVFFYVYTCVFRKIAINFTTHDSKKKTKKTQKKKNQTETTIKIDRSFFLSDNIKEMNMILFVLF